MDKVDKMGKTYNLEEVEQLITVSIAKRLTEVEVGAQIPPRCKDKRFFAPITDNILVIPTKRLTECGIRRRRYISIEKRVSTKTENLRRRFTSIENNVKPLRGLELIDDAVSIDMDVLTDKEKSTPYPRRRGTLHEQTRYVIVRRNRRLFIMQIISKVFMNLSGFMNSIKSIRVVNKRRSAPERRNVRNSYGLTVLRSSFPCARHPKLDLGLNF